MVWIQWQPTKIGLFDYLDGTGLLTTSSKAF
jgi:hypothetical protein